MIRRLGLVGVLALAAGCGTLHKAGKITQYINPAVDGKAIKRISLIGDGRDRANSQIIGRARARLSQAGVGLVVKTGTWESSGEAVKAICQQKPAAPDNVDAVAFVGWDHVALHDCKTLALALEVTGTYAGTDALMDKLIYYVGATPPTPAGK